MPGSLRCKVLGGETSGSGRMKRAWRNWGRERRLEWKDFVMRARAKFMLEGGRWERIDSTSSFVLSTRVAAELVIFVQCSALLSGSMSPHMGRGW